MRAWEGTGAITAVKSVSVVDRKGLMSVLSNVRGKARGISGESVVSS